MELDSNRIRKKSICSAYQKSSRKENRKTIFCCDTRPRSRMLRIRVLTDTCGVPQRGIYPTSAPGPPTSASPAFPRASFRSTRNGVVPERERAQGQLTTGGAAPSSHSHLLAEPHAGAEP